MSDITSPNSDNQSRTKYTIIIGIITIVAIVVRISFIATTPDIDRIIKTNDCNAAINLTDKDLENSNFDQQLQLGVMIAGCLFTP